MDTAEMSSRLSNTRALLPSLESALKSFASSSSRFRVIRTVKPSSSSSVPTSSSPADSSHPKTLFILDSSFNPPSIAHKALALAALRNTQEPRPHRLVLLFSTHNADKSPSPASFEHRLALMTVFAEDLAHGLSQSASSSSQPTSRQQQQEQQEGEAIPEIDVALTKTPYYVDKSIAIREEASPVPYPSHPTHIHLIGYDTLVRFLAPKYYPDSDPPLSALAPYFGAGHKVVAALRPGSTSVNQVDGDSEEEQREYVEGLKRGSLEKEGFKREWAERVRLVEVGEEAAGVSSTRIRKAAQKGEWKVLEENCTPGVAGWVREMALYGEDARGSKMA
ncbi:hypothetical protein LTS18_001068 [Coniosporium uncinatum]|uniref:Uncharacterized protein n=1 Tax=Coniosporium uncinatum TaxID=93489 RepID=A0ACC3DD08_9PEZI|nr:hypothetical protein LTS18_001068 [Coniosporium uncinatum]